MPDCGETLTDVDPTEVYFSFSRLRPFFSCGRRVQDTIDSVINGEIKPTDLPPIAVLVDKDGYMYSLNNRRLFVFKALKAKGLMQTIPVRVRPVPQTKRMMDKYSHATCAKEARLMLERDSSDSVDQGHKTTSNVVQDPNKNNDNEQITSDNAFRHTNEVKGIEESETSHSHTQGKPIENTFNISRLECPRTKEKQGDLEAELKALAVGGDQESSDESKGRKQRGRKKR
eukprot:Tbor_TRINITY_DN3444_c0_g1::TRINITY_DN3444_c0_g1_i2::g.3779::m.3779